MKKLFIAATMMAAAMSVNAKSSSDFFTHTPEEVIKIYGYGHAWMMYDKYCAMIKSRAAENELGGYVMSYLDSDNGNVLEASIMGLQEYNERHPDAFND